MSRPKPDRVPVKSTGVVSVGYNPWSEVLDIEFPGGSVYRYYRVPEQSYRELMTAPSKGRFVNSDIKPYFAYRAISEKHKNKK